MVDRSKRRFIEAWIALAGGTVLPGCATPVYQGPFAVLKRDDGELSRTFGSPPPASPSPRRHAPVPGAALGEHNQSPVFYAPSLGMICRQDPSGGLSALTRRGFVVVTDQLADMQEAIANPGTTRTRYWTQKLPEFQWLVSGNQVDRAPIDAQGNAWSYKEKLEELVRDINIALGCNSGRATGARCPNYVDLLPQNVRRFDSGVYVNPQQPYTPDASLPRPIQSVRPQGTAPATPPAGRPAAVVPPVSAPSAASAAPVAPAASAAPVKPRTPGF